MRGNFFSVRFKTPFGNRATEAILLNLYHYGEMHASAIARDANMALSPIQNQLLKLETVGILVSKAVGRARLYFFNKKSPYYKPVFELTAIVYSSIPLSKRETMFVIQRKPRMKGKPIK